MTRRRYSISQVARRFGLRVSALRYYGRTGLLAPAERRGNVRHYGPAELRRLALIQRLHGQGLVSLADTATLLAEVPEHGQPTWHDVLSRAAAAVGDQIRDLEAAHDTLRHLLECPDPDPIRNCPYLREQLDHAVGNAMDPAATRGTPPG